MIDFAVYSERSVFRRCADRAGIRAGTAIDALSGVDYILAVALADCLNGASLRTSSAGNAVIGNLVCHDINLLW